MGKLKRVGITLAARGPLPLPVLTQWSKVASRQVREALFILIHHNIVQYCHGEEGGPSAGGTLYHINIDIAILRLAYPIFSMLVERRFALEGAKLFLEVAKHGRLATTMIPEELIGSNILTKMLQEKYLEKVTPDCSIWVSKFTNESTSKTPQPSSPNRKRNISPSPIKSAKKFKMDPGAEPPGLNERTFVRIRISTFMNILKQNMLIDIAGRRINDAAAAVMQSALACVDGETDSGNTPSGSTSFSPFQVSTKLSSSVQLLVDSPNGSSSTFSEKSAITQYLDYLSQELDFFSKVDSRAGGLYSINFTMATNRLCMNAIEAFIVARFGQASARIFRVLQSHKMLEERTLSKVAMMPAKETRERLYELLKYGLVHLQEVPRTVDHAPSRTFFLWTIPIPSLYSRLCEMCLKFLANLLERIAFERRKHELLILKSERSDVVANPALLGEAEQRQLRSLRKILDRLSFHVLRIMREFLVLKHLDV